MSVFADYGCYYDLLYRDKDYQGEAEYVADLVKRFGSGSGSLLDMGCGTGGHAIIFAQMAFEVVGVDLSEQMIAEAQKKLLEVGGEVTEKVCFEAGDIRTLNLGRKFDAAVSLFHVMSYQTKNEDLHSVFERAREHLKPGGIFVFDFWYGPGVLTDRPEVREKVLTDGAIEIHRTARPRMICNDNCVDVNFELTIEDKATKQTERIEESHRMRYLFLPEVKGYLESTGFDFAFAYEWLSDKEPGFDSWQVCCGAVLREGDE